MKVTRVGLKNFLSFGDEVTEINLGDFNIVVGPNGAGKTNLLRALVYVAQILSDRGVYPSHEYYRAGTNEFRLEVGIALTEKERYALADFLVCEPLFESVSVSGTESQPVIQQHAFETAATLREVFAASFATIDIVVRGLGSETDTPDVSFRFRVEGMPFLLGRYGGIRVREEQVTSGTVLQFARFLVNTLQNADTRQELSAQFFAKLHAALENEYVGAQLAPWVSLNELEKKSGGREYATRLKDFLRDRRFFDDAVTLSSIMNAIYVGAVISVSDLRSRNKGFVALPTEPRAGRRATNSGDDDLGLRLFYLKNSVHSEERERYDSIKRFFNVFFNESFDFDVVLRDRPESPPIQPTSPYQALPLAQGPVVGNESAKIVHEVAVYVKDERAWVHLDFAAAGIFEMLFLLTAIIGHSDNTLLLDEPALNLHPTKQVELRKLLEESAENHSNQVILTTHSPFLVSTKWLEDTLRFQIDKSRTRVRRLPPEDHDLVPKMIKEFERNTKAVSILFASNVLLVEGDDEEAALPIWFEKCASRIDLGADNWVLVNVRGDQSFRAFAAIVKAWGIPYRILCDKKAATSIVGLEAHASILEENDFLDLVMKHCEETYQEAVKAFGPGYEGKNPTVMRYVAEGTEPPPEIEKIAKDIVMACRTS